MVFDVTASVGFFYAKPFTYFYLIFLFGMKLQYSIIEIMYKNIICVIFLTVFLDIKIWMEDSFMKLSWDKTEVFIFDPKAKTTRF